MNDFTSTFYLVGALEPETFTLKWPLFEVLGLSKMYIFSTLCFMPVEPGHLNNRSGIHIDTCLTNIFINHFFLFAFTLLGGLLALSFPFPVPDVVLVLLAMALDLLTPYVVTCTCNALIVQPQSRPQSLGSSGHRSPGYVY